MRAFTGELDGEEAAKDIRANEVDDGPVFILPW